MTDTAQPQERDIEFWETQREITHDEAKESALRFIDGNFKNDNEAPRISIPADPDRDDDLILLSYIAQQRRLRARPSPREVAKVLELWSSAAADLTEITPDTYRWALKQIAEELAALPVSPSPRNVRDRLRRALSQASDGREG